MVLIILRHRNYGDSMKIKITTVIKLVLLAVAMVVVLLTVALVRQIIIIDKELQNSALEEIYILQNQLRVEYESNIAETYDDLGILAHYADVQEIEYDAAAEFLSTQSQVDEFDVVYYVTEQGMGINADGETADFSENETFLEALQSGADLSMPVESATGEFLMDFMVPVHSGGQADTFLYTQISISQMYEALVEVQARANYVLVVDNSGSIVFSTDNAYAQDHVLDEDDARALGFESLNALQEDMREGESGDILFDIGEENHVTTYGPIAHTDWSLLITTDENGINNNLNASVSSILTIASFLIFLLGLAVVFSYFSSDLVVQTMQKATQTDPLTGLPNLAKLKKDMSEVLNKNQHKKYAIVKIDIENFKAINELFDFEMGNQVLKTFKTILDSIEEPSLMSARTGVDEIMLFAGNGFLEKLERTVGFYEAEYQKQVPQLGSHRIIFKYGRYRIDLGETDVDDIVNKVNMAHSMAKQSKGSYIYDYDSNYKRQILRSAEITNKMADALKNKEFKTYLQPKYSIEDNTIIGAEALVRWIEPSGDMVFPDEFIPVFEKNGFVVEVDRYVLHSVCAAVKKWLDLGYGCVPISVNCSRVNLNNENLVQEIAELVDRYGIPHEYIEIELTESTLIENMERLETLFTKLHKQNFRISIDDFGSGFSSLGLLKNLTVDTLKLDKSFFRDKKDIVRGDLIVDGIVKLAQSLNMYVVAEGIEEQEQINFLKNIGCDAVQGYFYAKPMPIDEFEEKYKGKMPLALPLADGYVPHEQVDGKVNGKFSLVVNVINAMMTPATICNGSFTELMCNHKAAELFGLASVQQWQEEFYNLSPKKQPDGRLSIEATMVYINKAKQNGLVKFYWMHVDLNGEEIPCEVSIHKLHLLDDNGEELYISHMNDLRGQLADFGKEDSVLSSGYLFDRITDKTLLSTITGLSEEWFFNYDISGSTIQFFGKIREELNLPKGRQMFPDPTLMERLVYKEDIEEFLAFVNALRLGEEKTFRVRLNRPNGGFLRYCFHYKVIRSEEGRALFAVGKVSEIEP